MKNYSNHTNGQSQSVQISRGSRSSYRWEFFLDYLKKSRKLRVLLAVATIFSLGVFTATAFLIGSLISKLSTVIPGENIQNWSNFL